MAHERLLLKLKCHRIDGSLLLWFRRFLTDHKQSVVVQGTHSSWSFLMLGVPQGTLLGPILFLIYVIDISSNISSTLRMFADITKVHRELSNIARDGEALQSVACSRRSDSGERCEVKRSAKNKSKGGGEVREGMPVRFVLNRLIRPLRPHQL